MNLKLSIDLEKHKAAIATSSRPQEGLYKTIQIANVGNYIPAYRIVGQISKPYTVSGENENEEGSLLTNKEVKRAQQNSWCVVPKSHRRLKKGRNNNR